VLRANRRVFEQTVSKTMRGGYVNGVTFDNVMLK
jgi:hypothetical protein